MLRDGAHKRLTREESRAQTREHLLEAAARVFARRGFHGASVEEVAEAAGYSTGALYSNFERKDDLFLTLLERRCKESVEQVREAFRGEGSVLQRLQRGGELLSEAMDRDRDSCLLFLELWMYAARDEKVGRRMAALYSEIRAYIAALIEAETEGLEGGLGAPVGDLAAALLALYDGYVLQKLVDPRRFPPEFFGRLLSLVVAGGATAVAPAGGPHGFHRGEV